MIYVEFIETRCRFHDWRIRRHTHPGFFRVLFLFGGQARIECDDRHWISDRPFALTLHPTTAQSFHFSQEAYGFILTMVESIAYHCHEQGFDPEHLAHLFLTPRFIDFGYRYQEAERIESLLLSAIREAYESWKDKMPMLVNFTSSILRLLWREYESKEKPTPIAPGFELFNRFRQLLEVHYTEQWSVAQYATQLRVHESVLQRVCRQLGHQSPFDMIQNRLVSEAKYRLTHLPNTIADIAYALGFDDPAYFSRFFKRHHRISPRAFREKIQPST